MPIPTKSDADLIESAYQDQVGLLFKQFFISVASENSISRCEWRNRIRA